MPTYEMACTDCDHSWEDVFSIHDTPPTECPLCHHSTAKRLISLTALPTSESVQRSGNELPIKVSSLKARDRWAALKEHTKPARGVRGQIVDGAKPGEFY
jgi:putative FmdB family regulatory protein